MPAKPTEIRPPASAAVWRGLAANPTLGLALLEPLLHGGDLLTLVALANRTDLTTAVAMALAGRAGAVRQALAANPVAAVQVWSVLVADPDREVRRALAEGRSRDYRPPPELPLAEGAQWKLAHDPDVEVRRALAYRSKPATRVGLHLAADPSDQVRRAVALSWRPLPDPVVRLLLADPDPQVRRNVLIGAAPPADLVAGLLADPETRPEAAERAAPGNAEIVALVADPDPEVRAAVARNPQLPLDAALRLGLDPDEEVRASVMLRRDLPDEARERIAASVEPYDYHVASWLLPHRATLAERLSYVDSRFVFCRRAVAFSSDLPPSAVAALAGDEDYSVRLLLAENHPDIPGEILPGLIERAGHARWELVRHPTVPGSALAEFAASGDEDLRRVAATGPNLPAAVAVALASHDDHVTRRLVAANPALPLPAVLRLLLDPDPQLAEAAARNPRIPAGLARRLVAHDG